MRSLQSALRNHLSAIDLLLGLAFFALYFFTLIPSVLPADSGEFQLLAWKLGIAHPPGYPLYTLTGWLFSRIFASPAFALNLLSAVLAAITLVILSRAVRALTGSRLAGLLAASLLGVSTTFWAQATTANIRMPTAFFTAVCAYVLVNWSRGTSLRAQRAQSPIARTGRAQQAYAAAEIAASQTTLLAMTSKRSDRYLVIFAFVFALGLGHHLSLLFPGIFFLAYICLIDPSWLKQPRRWIKPIGFFTLGLLPLLYLPLRGMTGGALSDGETMTYLAQPAQFLSYVSGRGFEGDFFYFITTRPDLFLDRVKLLPTLFDFQFNWLFFALFAVAAIRLILRDWKLAIMLLGGIALHTFVTLAYRAPQTVEYLIPAYVLLAIVIGYGLSPLRPTHRLFRFTHYVLYLACCVAIISLLVNHFPSFQWLPQNDDTRDYAESLLKDVPPDAIILSNWHWANPLWYLQQVEGVRPDVEVQYVFPRGEELAQSWLNAIDAGLKNRRPVIVNMQFMNEFRASPYFFEPISREAFLVRESPRGDLPANFQSLALHFGDKFELIGYSLPDEQAVAGEPLTVLFAWRVSQPLDRDYSFYVHLVEPGGRVVGQSDHTVPTTRYTVGDVVVERFFIAPLVDTPAGDYGLTTGIYSFEDGKLIGLEPSRTDPLQFVSIQVRPSDTLRQDLPPSAIPLSGGVRFVNSSASINGEVHPGDRITLDLNFTAARPLLRDTVVSVQMTGNGWRVTDDSVPALGAIPTLKWIAGSQVLDPHTLKVPDDAAPGPAQMSVILYDNFTQEPLALLDAELVKQGQAIPLRAVHVVAK